MNTKLQELYEEKIKLYESIITKIKTVDFMLLTEFEQEFRKIENIDKQISADPELSKEKLFRFKL